MNQCANEPIHRADGKLMRQFVADWQRYAPISEQEKRRRCVEVVKLCALGKSRKEIARALGVSVSSVYVYSTQATHLLGAQSLEHAVAIAVASGLVSKEAVLNETSKDAKSKSKDKA
jgi:DNA-binding CsgD family transcriptional regulator